MVSRVHDKANWPIVLKTGHPKPTEGGSCGFFVLWVIERLERGATQTFERSHKGLLCKRTYLLLHGYDQYGHCTTPPAKGRCDGNESSYTNNVKEKLEDMEEVWNIEEVGGRCKSAKEVNGGNTSE